jgi:transposase
VNNVNFEEVDHAILTGKSNRIVANTFGIAEGTVRRRKATLREQGHVLNPTYLPATPEVYHANHSPR